MDTPYGNIMKAVGQAPPTSYEPPQVTQPNQNNYPASAQQGKSGLSLTQQAENYDFFSREIMGKGVYLPDLVQTVRALQSEVAELKRGAKIEIDTDLFEAMEASVKGEPAVKEARQRMADAKSTVLTDLCMNDPRFKEAYDDYRRTVNQAYINRAEGKSDRKGALEVREDERGPHCDSQALQVI